MKITVVGSGYVGLVSGVCLADVGNHVCCLDVDPQKIATLQQGGVPIYEPGLQAMIQTNVAAGRLFFTTDIKEAVDFGQVQFIAVGTPPDEDGSADLQYLLAAARNIAEHMDEYKVIVDKSTVPVGTADKVKALVNDILTQRNAPFGFSVVSNPEFLKEGAAIDDFMRPDRIIIGCEDEQAKKIMHKLYQPFNRNHERTIFMDIRSAELTKYAANAMLATRISFMNELANLAEDLNADIEAVRQGIGADPRIGYHFLYPGVGYGGSCFPKDVKALIAMGKEYEHAMHVLTAVEHANDLQKKRIVKKVTNRFGENLSGKHFAVWGLAFKPNTDDMREAPSQTIINELTQKGATVCAFDPVATTEAKRIMGQNQALSFATDMMYALNDADALLIVTEWKAFKIPDFLAIKQQLKQAVIFDGRNIYQPQEIQQYGFEYYPIGRTV
ncbi:UDP-glucose dehydrogenase family protein [Neisseria sp. Ec49-e6-T10]|uniref:UDP-glucose dehydrogenase family protein n=1 Tax=Neisseria sp. Ec49-e6-T10 TaxID=3140744 RepID=UPI003EB86B59